MNREQQSGALLLAAISLAAALALAVVFTPTEKAELAPTRFAKVNTEIRLVRTVPLTRWSLWCERVGGRECR